MKGKNKRQKNERERRERERDVEKGRNRKEPRQLTRLAERSQLGPSAPGKHQESATPNVTLRTLLGSEMASQFS